MTMSLPPGAFDNPQRLRRGGRPAWGKLTSIGITVALHVVIAVAALTAVHVARPKVIQELSVQITPQKTLPAQDIVPPPPHLVVPSAVTAPPPEIVIQTITPPPVAALPAAKPVPPAPPPQQQAAGETRDSFLGRVLAQLGRFKQYPRTARQAHIEGVVMLHFVMDAQGKVLRCEIAQSSGRPVLDAEALALIRRAQPLPALPADYPTRTLDAVVPIEFSLGA